VTAIKFSTVIILAKVDSCQPFQLRSEASSWDISD